MTKSAAERAEINQRNGRQSHGPKTPEGKQRSRFNALKHGLKARVAVLPGEDPQQYQGRLEAWIADWMPSNDLEQSLVERAVTLSWQLDRAQRAETARLAGILRSAPAEAALRQQDEALALGQRLFFDRRGPLPLSPHALYSANKPRTSCSGLPDDPDDPPRLLLRLEATAAGCRWLLDRWAELGALLDQGQTWQSPDKLKAIRLLGHQPLDAADSEVVATIFQACRVLDPQVHHQISSAVAMAPLLRQTFGSGTDLTGTEGWAPGPDEPGCDRAAEPEPELEPGEVGETPGDTWIDPEKNIANQFAWQHCGVTFSELMGELTEEEAQEYFRRLKGRQVQRLRPQDPAAARAALRAIVEKAVIRLQAKLEVHQAQVALEAAEAVDRLCFDASAEGEHLRRFQLAGQRALLRTIDSLLKLRRQEPPQQTESDPAGIGATVAGLSGTICGDNGIPSRFVADLLPAVPDPLTAPEPEHDLQNLPNEPNAAAADPPSAAEESHAAGDDQRISPNEPGHAPRAGNASPPPQSDAQGKATEAGADPSATPTRSAPGADPLLPAPQGSHRPVQSDARGRTNPGSRRPAWLPESPGVTP
jgi:hypothetical protein